LLSDSGELILAGFLAQIASVEFRARLIGEVGGVRVFPPEPAAAIGIAGERCVRASLPGGGIDMRAALERDAIGVPRSFCLLEEEELHRAGVSTA